mmetsp:Transcript_36567/g.71914  ORF Transcript_36567/g.71914 Transcript_36567/m.71914 type:complete len:92 (+) Transcript_36567:328-603(+)
MQRETDLSLYVIFLPVGKGFASLTLSVSFHFSEQGKEVGCQMKQPRVCSSVGLWSANEEELLWSVTSHRIGGMGLKREEEVERREGAQQIE